MGQNKNLYKSYVMQPETTVAVVHGVLFFQHFFISPRGSVSDHKRHSDCPQSEKFQNLPYSWNRILLLWAEHSAAVRWTKVWLSCPFMLPRIWEIDGIICPRTQADPWGEEKQYLFHKADYFLMIANCYFRLISPLAVELQIDLNTICMFVPCNESYPSEMVYA